ncbi:unnamed protein product [Mytilus edulis]|uniref:Uncharacterized protein n=1 Tax=Mytilus edulis TaxID=6550 RepID=A0A8S3TJG2_MYTED|nr:unnamed protein product [Mytilus edulis]
MIGLVKAVLSLWSPISIGESGLCLFTKTRVLTTCQSIFSRNIKFLHEPPMITDEVRIFSVVFTMREAYQSILSRKYQVIYNERGIPVDPLTKNLVQSIPSSEIFLLNMCFGYYLLVIDYHWLMLRVLGLDTRYQYKREAKSWHQKLITPVTSPIEDSPADMRIHYNLDTSGRADDVKRKLSGSTDKQIVYEQYKKQKKELKGEPTGTYRSYSLGEPTGTYRSNLLGEPTGTYRSYSLGEPTGTYRSYLLGEPTGTYRSYSLGEPTGTYRSYLLGEPTGTYRSYSLGNLQVPTGVIHITGEFIRGTYRYLQELFIRGTYRYLQELFIRGTYRYLQELFIREPTGTYRSNLLGEPTGTYRSYSLGNLQVPTRNLLGTYREPTGTYRSYSLGEPTGTYRSNLLGEPTGTYRSYSLGEPTGTYRSYLLGNLQGNLQVPTGVIYWGAYRYLQELFIRGTYRYLQELFIRGTYRYLQELFIRGNLQVPTGGVPIPQFLGEPTGTYRSNLLGEPTGTYRSYSLGEPTGTYRSYLLGNRYLQELFPTGVIH